MGHNQAGGETVPPGNHYAGGAYYYLEFTNLSGHSCTLRGYPGVSAVSLSGASLGSPAGWGVVKPAAVSLEVIPYPFPACAHPGPVYLHAGPVMPGFPT